MLFSLHLSYAAHTPSPPPFPPQSWTLGVSAPQQVLPGRLSHKVLLTTCELCSKQGEVVHVLHIGHVWGMQVPQLHHVLPKVGSPSTSKVSCWLSFPSLVLGPPLSSSLSLAVGSWEPTWITSCLWPWASCSFPNSCDSCDCCCSFPSWCPWDSFCSFPSSFLHRHSSSTRACQSMQQAGVHVPALSPSSHCPETRGLHHTNFELEPGAALSNVLCVFLQAQLPSWGYSAYGFLCFKKGYSAYKKAIQPMLFCSSVLQKSYSAQKKPIQPICF